MVPIAQWLEHCSVAAGIRVRFPLGTPNYKMDFILFKSLNDLAGRQPFLDGFFIFLAEYFWFFLIFVFAIAIFCDRRTPAKQKRFWFWSALISAGLARFGLTEVIRFFYHHPRPFVENQVIQLISETSFSFPSGHTIFIFALAAMVYFYHRPLAWRLGLGGLIMAVSRVIVGVHWPSDILGGAVLGILFSLIFYNYIVRKLKRFAF